LRKRYAQLLTQARIPEHYARASLASFKTDGDRGGVAFAKITACQFVEQYPLNKTGLLLLGPSGLGKTHLAIGIIRELIQTRGVPCLFFDYRELLKEIQNSYNPSVQATELDILRPVFETEVLVLDDLGAVKPTEWVWDAVGFMLSRRYNDNRTTIITTNFEDGPAKAAMLNGAARAGKDDTLGDRVGERMRSRLHEMCRTVAFDGKDYRGRIHRAPSPQ
jgi:DNA replication protein DnaC